MEAYRRTVARDVKVLHYHSNVRQPHVTVTDDLAVRKLRRIKHLHSINNQIYILDYNISYEVVSIACHKNKLVFVLHKCVVTSIPGGINL